MGKVRRKSSRRSRRRHQGGAVKLDPASVHDSLAGNWSSKISLGQGANFNSYDPRQTGGVLATPASTQAITDSVLPSNLWGSARVTGTFNALSDSAKLQDGGRRRSHRHHKLHCHCRRCKSRRRQQGGQRKSRRQQGGQRKSRRRQRRQGGQRRSRRRQGGALGYSTINASPMLLDSDGYAQAGLNPEFRSMDGVEFDAAYNRQAM
jgi:hypothetical protein